MLENITTFLTENNELAWIAIFIFAFMESFILSFMVSSLILFSICVFAYNTDLLALEIIVLLAVLGSHLGDISGFFFGKRLGPTILGTKFIKKREKKINNARRFLEKNGSYSVILGRFVPAIRSIVPFLLGISNLKPVRFYIVDVIACSFWGIALAFLLITSATFIG
tara:strand:+ start:383 stop:883 length:501 start_codon:yes stop_codon:yes gene_type:complete